MTERKEREKILKANKAFWESCAEKDADQKQDENQSVTDWQKSEFNQGQDSLLPCDHAALPEVEGKTLLHLMCHKGLDTLSWARRGAIVTGVDFSGKAIASAQQRAKETDARARFIASDVYDLPNALKETFDIVYTSRGVLAWLPDLKQWAKVIAGFLKPGGVFFIHEEHPLVRILKVQDSQKWVISRDYFACAPGPAGASTSSPACIFNKIENYRYYYTLNDVFNSLIEAGLTVTAFTEDRELFWQRLPEMQTADGRRWRMPPELDLIPLSFTLKARK